MHVDRLHAAAVDDDLPPPRGCALRVDMRGSEQIATDKGCAGHGAGGGAELAPDVKNMIGLTGDPTRADYGFGLGLAVRTTPGIARMMGSVGDFSWPGASGTNWWVDPREELVVVFMAHTPGPMRWKYRQMINALVYQALAD